MNNRETQLVGLNDAALLAKVDRSTIVDWEKRGWLKPTIKLAPRSIGRPGKLYDVEEVKRVARSRGRQVD